MIFLENVNYKALPLVNDAGRMVQKWFREIRNKYSNVYDDAFIVMPNHFHGVINIMDNITVGADLCVCPDMDNPHAGEHTNAKHEKGEHYYSFVENDTL